MFYRIPLTCLLLAALQAGAEIQVHTNFPGGAIELHDINHRTQTITFGPADHKNRGWVCCWYFKLTGIDTSKPITLRLQSKNSFGRPTRAMFSLDNTTWKHTSAGKHRGPNATYVHRSTKETIWFGWGVPFQLADATRLVDRIAKAKVGAEKFELCKSNEGRSVPALKWEPNQPAPRRGIWIEARQHAWESGSSWVCQGLLEWLASDDERAVRLRNSARIVIVPIMDVDNVERGAGGKNQIPHDHNRDWNAKPRYAEVAAAQQLIKQMDAEGEFDMFLDLHNPGPRDGIPFFFAPPKTHLSPERMANHKRFHEICLQTLGKEPLGFSKTLRISGPGYHPLWRAISKNWIAENTAKHTVALTLETSWNTENSTQTGYLAYGRALGQALAGYFLTK